MSDGAPLPPLCPGTPKEDADCPRYAASASTIGARSCFKAMPRPPVHHDAWADRAARFTNLHILSWEQSPCRSRPGRGARECRRTHSEMGAAVAQRDLEGRMAASR